MGTIIALLFASIVAGLVHHYFTTVDNRWFDWEQFINQLNHETLILFALIAGISLLVGERLASR